MKKQRCINLWIRKGYVHYKDYKGARLYVLQELPFNMLHPSLKKIRPDAIDQIVRPQCNSFLKIHLAIYRRDNSA